MAIESAPTLDTVVAVSDTQIDLAWTPAGDGGEAITGYKIERNLNSAGFATLVADTGNTNETYSDTTLSTGDHADYRVSTINGSGTSPASNELGADTFTVADAPVLDSATAVSDTEIDLSWTAPVSDGGSAVTGYKIERNVDSGGWTTIVADTGNTDTTYNDNTLTTGQQADYRISAINSVGTSTASNVVGDTTFTVPDAPVLDSATAISDTEIDLSWTAPMNDGGDAITGYKIESNINGAGWTTLVADTGNTDTTYNDSSLSTGDQVDYRISAINSVGAGAASNVEGDTTFTVPAAPVLTLVDTNKTSLEISWTTPDDGGSALDHYTVEWSENADFSDSDTHEVAAGTNIYTIPSLTTGTEYYVRVTANNAIGDSAASNVITATPDIPTVTFTPKPDKSEVYNKSYFYEDGINIPVNSDSYEDQAFIDFRNYKKLLLQMLNIHASKGLTYEVRGIIHEGDNEIPPTDTEGIKKWEIINADVAVAAGASSAKTVENEWSYILIRTKRTSSGGSNDSEGELRLKVLQ